ncbi:hypothetical protein HNQ00_002320 [Flavobacterium sp. 14A]|nr:hypothetical protein [Flavobacterium sp. 14A]
MGALAQLLVSIIERAVMLFAFALLIKINSI